MTNLLSSGIFNSYVQNFESNTNFKNSDVYKGFENSLTSIKSEIQTLNKSNKDSFNKNVSSLRGRLNKLRNDMAEFLKSQTTSENSLEINLDIASLMQTAVYLNLYINILSIY